MRFTTRTLVEFTYPAEDAEDAQVNHDLLVLAMANRLQELNDLVPDITIVLQNAKNPQAQPPEGEAVESGGPVQETAGDVMAEARRKAEDI